MKNLFQLDGPVMRAMSDLCTLVILNLLTMLFCVPVVTAGASLAAMHYILMQMPKQEVGHVAPEFLKQFRANLKSATVPWLLLLAACGLLYADYLVFTGEGMPRALAVPAYVGFALAAMLFVWMFPLLARFDNTVSATYRNSLILSVSSLPRTLGMVFFWAVIPFVLTQSLRLLPLAFLVGLTLPGYFSMLLYDSVIEGLVENTKSRQHGAGDAQETAAGGTDAQPGADPAETDPEENPDPDEHA